MPPLLLFARGIGDPTRLRLLFLLGRGQSQSESRSESQSDETGGELCVCELTDALEIGQSTLSSHLQTLRQSGLVLARKKGKWMYYRLESAHLPVLQFLFELHRESLQRDETLKNDLERLKKRLELRSKGCCVVGFSGGC